MLEEKSCCTCKEIKPITEFYKNRSNKDGLRPDCKKCANIASNKWNKRNLHKIRLSYNSWNIGVDSELYWDFLNSQNNKCAICNKTVQENKKNLAIDHCHKTDKIRGLLCTKCNLGIGYFRDNVEILKSAINYIENPPLLSRNLQYRARRKSSIPAL